MRRINALLASLASITLAACSGQSQQSTSPQSQVPAAAASPLALTNPTDFPIIEGGKILDVKAFKQTVESSGQSSALAAEGAGTYAGNEVLAESTASDAALQAWLAGVEKAPPAGYTFVANGSSSSPSVAKALRQYGIECAVFRTTDQSKKRAVVIVAMDPKLVKEKLGIAIDLVQKYRSLPSYLRQPIDDRLKEKTGFTGTEATDPSAPLGITLAALKELQNSDQRAIVMVDASKR